MRAEDFFRELEAENPLPSDAAAEIDAPYILAENLYRLRKARGLSQIALAKALRVSQPRIAQIERGDANLRIGTLARLAVALGCDMRELLAPAVEPEPVKATQSVFTRERLLSGSQLPTLAQAANDNFAMAA